MSKKGTGSPQGFLRAHTSMPKGRHIAAELRDECLNQEIFLSLKEAQIVIEQWRNQYNTIRPHSSLGSPQTSTGQQPNLDQHAPIQ